MKITTEFVLDLNRRARNKIPDEFSMDFIRKTHKKIANEISAEFYEKRRRIKSYKVGRQYLDLDLYRMEEENPLYKEIAEFVSKYKEEIDFVIADRQVEMTEEEEKQAIAFLPDFKNWCEEYDDKVKSYENCYYCHNYLKAKDKKIYIKSNGYIRKKAKEYGVSCVGDDMDRYLIFPKLYEKMIEEGILEQYFIPVYAKNNKIVGYELGSSHTVSEMDYQDENYYLRRKCCMCGTSSYYPKEGEYFYQPKWIREEVLTELEPVNLTEGYYYRHRKTIVSRQFYDIVKKYVPNAGFLPVFLKE